MSTTTELNRAIAKAKGWIEVFEHPDGPVRFWADLDKRHYEGSAWADRADVALAELWEPDLMPYGHVLTCCKMRVPDNPAYRVELVREYGYEGNSIHGDTLAIAICRAWLALKGVDVE